MGDLWKRRIIVELPGLKRAGEPLRYEYPPWGITFKVEFDTTPQQNRAEIALWNLSRDTILTLKRGLPVKLSAGYEADEVGVCFVGVIDQIETKHGDVDKITTLKCIDGKNTVLSARPNLSWEPGVSIATVVEQLFRVAGVAIGFVLIAEGKKYEKGKVCSPDTTVAGHLDQVLKDVKSMTGQEHQWYLDLGRGYFVPRTWDGNIGRIVTVTPQTGLIGTPEPLNVVTANVAASENEPKQWRVTTVFNWRIANGAQIRVEAQQMEGRFRIQRGQHIGGPKDRMVTDLLCDEIEIKFKSSKGETALVATSGGATAEWTTEEEAGEVAGGD